MYTIKGLILKDLYKLQNFLIGCIPILILALALTIWSEMFIPILLAVTLLSLSMLFIIFDNDIHSDYERYAATLPLRRRDIVTARYLLALALALITQLLLSLIMGLSEWLSIHTIERLSLAGIYVGLYLMELMALVLPMLFKLGVHGKRPIVFFAVLLLLLINGLLFNVIADTFPWRLIGLVPMLWLLSYFIAAWIYQRRDF